MHRRTTPLGAGFVWCGRPIRTSRSLTCASRRRSSACRCRSPRRCRHRPNPTADCCTATSSWRLTAASRSKATCSATRITPGFTRFTTSKSGNRAFLLSGHLRGRCRLEPSLGSYRRAILRPSSRPTTAGRCRSLQGGSSCLRRRRWLTDAWANIATDGPISRRSHVVIDTQMFVWPQGARCGWHTRENETIVRHFSWNKRSDSHTNGLPA